MADSAVALAVAEGVPTRGGIGAGVETEPSP